MDAHHSLEHRLRRQAADEMAIDLAIERQRREITFALVRLQCRRICEEGDALRERQLRARVGYALAVEALLPEPAAGPESSNPNSTPEVYAQANPYPQGRW